MVPVGWLVGQLGSVLKNPSLVELDYRCWSFVFGVFMCQLVYRGMQTGSFHHMFKYSTVKNCCAKRKKGRGERRFKVQRDDALAQQEQPTTRRQQTTQQLREGSIC